MPISSERYVVDADGNRVGVVLDMVEYGKLLEALEELEAIRAYDAAKEAEGERIPLDQALAEIEEGLILVRTIPRATSPAASARKASLTSSSG